MIFKLFWLGALPVRIAAVLVVISAVALFVHEVWIDERRDSK